MLSVLDGVLDAKTADYGVIQCNAGTPLCMGSVPGYLEARAYTGLVDEVELYNRALSAEEIQGIYAAQNRGD